MTIVLRTVAAILLSCAAALAQTAEVSGLVKDLSGAAVGGAQIKLTQTTTGAVYTATSGPDGAYTLTGVPAGRYKVEIGKQGFQPYTEAETAVPAAGKLALNATLEGGTAPSLGELGFPAEATKGSAQNQALLNKRSHMLQIHQRLGLITLAPLIATLVASNGAGGRHSTASGRELHAALGGSTAALYFTSAGFAIFAPKIPGTPTRGPIRLHKALAWIHGPGMILTPILGAMAYNQRSEGERLHGIAQAHGAVAIVTAAAYGASILAISIRF